MLRVVVVTAVLVSACAAPNGQGFSVAGYLEGGAVTAPPEGLAEYCQRAALECGASSGATLRGRFAPTGAPGFQRASSGRGGAALFHALLAQRRAASETQQSSSPALAITPVVDRRVLLDDARRDELARINRRINRAIRPTVDLALYGREEYWVRPIVAGQTARGDCEDYALEKRAALIAAGWPVEALSLAVAVSPRVGLHAVLVVSTDQGDLVLDNLYDRPQPIGRLDYVWVSRQRGADLTAWTSVRLMIGLPGAQSPTDLFHAMLRERSRTTEGGVVAAPVTLDAALILAEAGEDLPASDGGEKPLRVSIKPRAREQRATS